MKLTNKKTNKSFLLVLFTLFLILISCHKNNLPGETKSENLTIFFINDQQAEINNFAKIKFIIDSEKEENPNVIVVCSGDIFSGNPIVDIYPEKGYPIVDIMNKIGFDVCTIGNHEFDYGQDVLKNRMEQSQFKWICANVDMSNSVIPQPEPYTTIQIGDLKITFLGLIETNGSMETTIPSTHPWKLINIVFQRPENVINNYSDIKLTEDADLYIALTHLGHNSYYSNVLCDYDIAENYPFVDLIIGAHTEYDIDTNINNIPIFQTEGHLEFLGKIKLTVKDKKIQDYEYQKIYLNFCNAYDETMQKLIDEYNNSMPELDEVIGYSSIHHYRNSNVGCFYTDAIRTELNVDFCIQNGGGIRNDLEQGDITPRDIYSIDPFNNGALIYNISIGDFKNFVITSHLGFCYSGIEIYQENNNVIIKNMEGEIIDDTVVLSLGINDYIPSVYSSLFPDNPTIVNKTTAQVIIDYLNHNPEPVNYPSCNRYFRFL